jgi:hypothetical protein
MKEFSGIGYDIITQLVPDESRSLTWDAATDPCFSASAGKNVRGSALRYPPRM